jgi:hypothetical protein
LVMRLLNLIEDLSADLREAQAEDQRLRDEINRLKGEQGKPHIPANTPKRSPGNYSSEPERRQRRRRSHRSKDLTVRIDREQVLEVDRATLPADAEFKGYEDVVVQDLILRSDNICFHKEKYYAASSRQSYLAALPRGYEGQFGPGLKALVLTWYFGGQMSEPKIRELLEYAGVQISVGQVSHLLIKGQADFHAEQAAVYEAGLRSSPWQHTDHTSTRVAGQNQYCHIVCNPLYTVYRTLPGKDRLSVLEVLRQGRPHRFRLNEEAWQYLEHLPLPQATRQTLSSWVGEEAWSEPAFLERLQSLVLPLRPQLRQLIMDAAAVADYHADQQAAVVRLLVCDDAPQFNWLTPEMGLCWVHEGRHYKKLLPVMAWHQRLLHQFQQQFWAYYHQLLRYRQAPSPAEQLRLTTEFDRLFAQCTGYAALDACIVRTRAKKEALLMVLKHPEIPLHNNPAELAARQRVRKRDVSFGPRTQEGVKAWDTFMSLAATTRKLGISFYQYIHDRVSETHQIPPLARVIEARAQELALGASWSVP